MPGLLACRRYGFGASQLSLRSAVRSTRDGSPEPFHGRWPIGVNPAAIARQASASGWRGCSSTARGVTSRRAAISLLGRPSRIIPRTSRSLPVSFSNLERTSSWLDSRASRSASSLTARWTFSSRTLTVERLLEELDRARLHRPHSHRNVGIRSDEETRASARRRPSIPRTGPARWFRASARRAPDRMGLHR